jgi:hypothetical protein
MPKVEQIERRSFRIHEIAGRNGLSIRKVYKEIEIGRLKASKAGDATIVTTEQEADWLAALPAMQPSRPAA